MSKVSFWAFGTNQCNEKEVVQQERSCATRKKLCTMAPRLTEARKNELLGMLEAGMAVKEVAKHTGHTLQTVYAIKKRKEAGLSQKLKGKGGRRRSIVNRNLIERVRKRIKRNPFQTIRGLFLLLNVPRTSMRRVVRAAGFKSVTPLVQHDIMPGQEVQRLERAKKLLSWHKKNMEKVVVWSDEKLFYAETHVNKQNDRILVPLICTDNSIRIVRRAKNPSKVMVFLAVASDGAVMPPILFPPDCKVNSKVYQEQVLSRVVTWMHERYGQGLAIFQQNGAPAHTSKASQKYLEDNLGKEGFWPKDFWPPSRYGT